MSFQISTQLIPAGTTINFYKKSITNGWNYILNQLSAFSSQNRLFCVNVSYRNINIGIIFQTYNLYIVGLQSPNFSVITNDLQDVRYRSEIMGFPLSPDNFFKAFQNASNCFPAASPSASTIITNVTSFFHSSQTNDLRLLVFALSECARNNVLRHAFYFNYKWETFNDLKTNLGLTNNAKSDSYAIYSTFKELINNWRNIAEYIYESETNTQNTKNIVKIALDVREIRSYFNNKMINLTPDQIQQLQELGIY